MKKIFNEDEVSSESLQAHFMNSGLTIENPKDMSFGVRSRKGLYIGILMDEERKYLGFTCYFDLDTQRSEFDKLLLVQRYNYDIFLASFAVTKKNPSELIVSYFMSYEMGLIAGQMMHVFRRFSGLLDNLVENENDDKFIVLGKPDKINEESNTTENIVAINVLEGKPKGTEQ